MKLIDTQYLRDHLDNHGVKIIDIRTPEAYNGWRLNGEKRGGHIKGAHSLPYKWINYIDWPDIVKSKGFQSEDTIILYGYENKKIETVANRFIRNGFKNVKIYKNFVNEWSYNPDMPMDKLKRYRHLVSAQWLHELINTGNADEYENDKYIICHAHYQNRKDYEEGHIPNAIDIDTNLLESTKTWNRRTPEELNKTLTEHGITHDTTVVLYGKFSFPDYEDPFPGSSAGHLGAIRAAVIMMYAGVKDVRILNGGFRAWTDEGFESTTDEYVKYQVDNFGTKIPTQPTIFIDTPEAKEYIASDNKNLVSVRSWPEYIGKVSGYHYIMKKGRIPGSVFGNCGSDAYHMENYRNLDHTTREYHEIEHMWLTIGVTPDKYNAFYCGTGWRGSEAFYNAWLIGWPNIAVYDGGWFEWSNDKNNPIESGYPNT